MEEKPDIYHIPSNYKTPGKWKSIAIPNLAEGIFVALIVDYFLVKAPFTIQFKMIAVSLVSVGIVAFFIKGINGERVSMIFLSFLKFLVILISRKGKYHMKKVGMKDVKTSKNRVTGKRKGNIGEAITSFKNRTNNKV